MVWTDENLDDISSANPSQPDAPMGPAPSPREPSISDAVDDVRPDDSFLGQRRGRFGDVASDHADLPRSSRRSKQRRRVVDPTTFEKQYSASEMEFMTAIQAFKVRTGKPFPTHSEVLAVAKSLGYSRTEVPPHVIDPKEGAEQPSRGDLDRVPDRNPTDAKAAILSESEDVRPEDWINRRATEQALRAATTRHASGRRRFVDPTTCEGDFSPEEIEYLQAMQRYKKASGRVFPTWSEVLEVLRDLGYAQTPAESEPGGREV